MINEIDYPISYICELNSSYTFKACPPLRISCEVVTTDGYFLNDPSDAWNCNLCKTDKEFCMPFLMEDSIYIQTTFADKFNADISNPVYHWDDTSPNFYVKAELLDINGSVISSDVRDFASEYNVTYSGGRSYQNLLLDLDAIVNTLGLTCFSFKISSFLDVGGVPTLDKEIWTEPYCLDETCQDSLLAEGIFSGVDCFGFYYGENEAFAGSSDFSYRNIFRVPAKLLDIGASISSVEVGNITTQKTVADLYELRFYNCIPIYFKNILVKQFLASEVLQVSGIDYKFTGTFSNLLPDTISNMFVPVISLEKECTNDFRCN